MTFRPPHIALIVETSMESGRQILGGIAKYATKNGPWSIFHQPAHLDQRLPKWIDNWDGDGIIVRISNKQVVDSLRRKKIPVIDVLAEIEDSGVPLVHVDDAAIALAAFQHLAERDFKNYAYVGADGYNWSENRGIAFQKLVREAGHECQNFLLTYNAEIDSWENEQDGLAAWLKSLRKPCGLMAGNDCLGQRILEACHRASIFVPEEMAVIGVDNDDVLCTLSNPTLSSINPGHFQVGYEAAHRLAKLMRGEPVEDRYFVPKYYCVSRESTDATAVENPTLAAALSYIRTNACQDIRSTDVAKFVGVSLSTLKRLFAVELNKTINRCIIRAKIDRAKILLKDTELSVEQITQRIGYSHAHYFSLAFKRETTMSPRVYRKEHESF